MGFKMTGEFRKRIELLALDEQAKKRSSICLKKLKMRFLVYRVLQKILARTSS